MDIRNFILHQKFENMDKEIERIEREKQNNGFNLFTISSYNSYLENFHSDVIALLLSPKERHLQKEKFFKLFLSFLIEKYGANPLCILIKKKIKKVVHLIKKSYI